MEFIIDFYKSLDTLNLIIFWGIITVIILLLIFSLILINKNKKLKSLIEKNSELEDLPIKKTEVNQPLPPEESKKVPQHDFIEPSINKIEKEEKNGIEINKQIQTEKKFIAEEHVMEYNNEVFSLSNIQKANEHKEEVTNHDIKRTASIEIPTGPYQRNVLREMSLSQTSPIGITKPISKETKKIEIAKDLEQSLNSESVISQNEYNNNNNNKLSENTETKQKKQATNQIKKELINIDHASPRKTTIIAENTYLNKTVKYESKNNIQEECKTTKINYMDMVNIETPAKELLNLEPQIFKEKNQKTSSEKYLEEVSQKLAEAEVSDEIERTNYELKQEEEAIISYKELMEKKDSIQTIDEEEAIISIEELMNHKKKEEEKNQKKSNEKYLDEVSQKLAEAEVPNEIERTNYELKQEEEAIISYKELMEKKDSIQTIDEEEAVISMEELMNHQKKQEEKNKSNNKLYNFSEEEENEKFIKELKQFRNDL